MQFALENASIANPPLVVRDGLVKLAATLAWENTTRPPERQRVVVVRLDELQNADNEQRSKLLFALGDVLEHEERINVHTMVHLPVLLYVTGLPDVLNRATNVDTFRRRFDTIPLGTFSDAEMVNARQTTSLPEGVRIDGDAAHAFADIIAGASLADLHDAEEVHR